MLFYSNFYFIRKGQGDKNKKAGITSIIPEPKAKNISTKFRVTSIIFIILFGADSLAKMGQNIAKAEFIAKVNAILKIKVDNSSV